MSLSSTTCDTIAKFANFFVFHERVPLVVFNYYKKHTTGESLEDILLLHRSETWKNRDRSDWDKHNKFVLQFIKAWKDLAISTNCDICYDDRAIIINFLRIQFGVTFYWDPLVEFASS
jgi:hypothetical protein